MHGGSFAKLGQPRTVHFPSVPGKGANLDDRARRVGRLGSFVAATAAWCCAKTLAVQTRTKQRHAK